MAYVNAHTRYEIDIQQGGYGKTCIAMTCSSRVAHVDLEMHQYRLS